jgi:UPF0755 protein
MVKKKEKSKLRFVLKIIISLFILLVVAGGIIAYNFYKKIYYPNVKISSDKSIFYIPTGSNFDYVASSLYEAKIISDKTSFEWLSDLKEYSKNIKPGRYRLLNNMSNNELVNLLRSGNQEPIKLTFTNIRTIEQLAGKVGRVLEPDSAELISIFKDPGFVKKYGFNQRTFLTLFIPNTYEFFWNTSATEFIERMAKEYKSFWTAERKSKADAMNMSQSDVSILASIVEMETIKKDERPRVAGVYMNRLKKRMLLQADPTVIYAIGDFTINRVLKVHLQFDSPYNTYLYEGLPPGPIYLPSINAIDAVLNYERHNYIFFCAREDFSGYHSFAQTLQQHNVNARKYQMALNKRKIMK